MATKRTGYVKDRSQRRANDNDPRDDASDCRKVTYVNATRCMAMAITGRKNHVQGVGNDVQGGGKDYSTKVMPGKNHVQGVVNEKACQGPPSRKGGSVCWAPFKCPFAPKMRDPKRVRPSTSIPGWSEEQAMLMHANL